jgi:hypothetical protein
MAAAMSAIFSNAGFVVPATIQSSALVQTPFYAFHFANGGVADQHQQLVYGFREYDHFKGILDVQIFTSRSENTTSSLGLYRSRVRQLFNLWRGKWAQLNLSGVTLCPYYQVLDIWDRGMTPTVESNEDLDMSAMHYEIKFAINPDAWPAPDANQTALTQTQNFG